MSDSQPRRWPGLATAWWTAVVGAIFNGLSLLDRTVISVVLPEIRSDLGLTAFQISAVQGISFVMFYSVMGVVIGGLVDRYSRRWIMWGSITIWSLATAAHGLVATYRGLFAARLVVGFGEASISPAGHSMLALNFPRDRLATPLSLFVATGLGGTGLAYYLGGELLTYFQHAALPAPFAGLAPWRLVMIAIGLPGILIALLAFTMNDPRDSRPIEKHELASWGDYFTYLLSHWRLFLAFMVGYAFVSIVNTATTFWAPTYARTVLGAPADEMGKVMALAVGVSGVVGGVVMGLITDWLTRRGVLDAPLRCFFVSAAIGIPVSAAGYLADSLTMLYIGLAVFQATVVATYGPMLAGIQIISPVAMRGRMASTVLLTATIGAFAVGPMITGALTTYVFGDARIGPAVATTILIAGPIGTFFFWLARKHYIARMEALS
jgi:MFS family permease